MWTPSKEGIIPIVDKAGSCKLPAELGDWFLLSFFIPVALLIFFVAPLYAADINLQQLIAEASANNPELQAARYKAVAAGFRVPQEESLPDPMFTFGYQNMGFSKYTYGKEQESQWMFSASQAVPFPGKLSLKGQAAAKESESLGASYENARLKIISRIKELYSDLYTAYKTLDLLNERIALFSAIEEAALARYSTGKGSQQEVLTSQTEKYIIIEKETVLRQKIETLEAALNIALGRRANIPLGRPAAPAPTFVPNTLDELILISSNKSPDVGSRDKMISAAEARLAFAKKNYIPDFVFTGNYSARGNGFLSMWSFTAGINIPIFALSKQVNAEKEADASLAEAKKMMESTMLTVTASIRDNFSRLKTAEKLMPLYKEGLIPKGLQDFDLSLSSYKTGAVDAPTVIAKLKSVIDYEIAYWNQFAEHEKAAARIEAISGVTFSAEKSE
jgi:outer membrane protein, heavy metal efflux system